MDHLIEDDTGCFDGQVPGLEPVVPVLAALVKEQKDIVRIVHRFTAKGIPIVPFCKFHQIHRCSRFEQGQMFLEPGFHIRLV